MNENENYEDFWKFFKAREKEFFNTVKNNDEVEKNFLDEISPAIKNINENFFFLTGMCEDETAELIITVDGNLKEIANAEDFIATAPTIENWRLTALKPESEIENVSINMNGFVFDKNNIFFYSNDDQNYPDEIDLTFVHTDFNEENENEIFNGTFIFLDNFLGEFNFVTQIDNYAIIGKDEAEKKLIPIEKLRDFLSWREKEFIEKYKGAKITTDDDSFSMLEATLNNGFPLIATVNSDLLKWDKKASHPWISVFRIEYNGDENNGFPNEEDYEKFNSIEDQLLAELKSEDGNLNIGRETAENIREIYFASKDFRKISKVLAATIQQYPEYVMSFEIYKDKYWQSFARYEMN